MADNRFEAVANAVDKKNPSVARQLLIQSADLYHKAAEAPTLIIRDPGRYRSRIMGIAADIGVVKMTRSPEPIHMNRIRMSVTSLLLSAESRKWITTRDDGLELLIMLLTDSFELRMKNDWALETPEGSADYRKRNQELYLFGRSILNVWSDESPKLRSYERVSKKLDSWARRKGLVQPPESESRFGIAPAPKQKN